MLDEQEVIKETLREAYKAIEDAKGSIEYLDSLRQRQVDRITRLTILMTKLNETLDDTK